MRHLPNALSIIRLVLAPFVFFLLWKQYWEWALGLLAVAALTDAFDGYVARHFGAASQRGEMLDPIADKVLLGSAFFAMVLNGSIEVWLAAIVIGRDVLILAFAGGALARSRNRRFPPSIWGKLSTICQCLFILALAGNLTSAVPTAVVTALKWAVAVFAAISGLDYARRAASVSHAPFADYNRT